jgi:hypothetical protein
MANDSRRLVGQEVRRVDQPDLQGRFGPGYHRTSDG